MENVLTNITSYAIFVYILPGALAIGLYKYLFNPVNFLNGYGIEFFIASYYTGLIISKVSSLVIRKILATNISNFRFIDLAEEKNSKIKEFNIEFNMIKSIIFIIACSIPVEAVIFLMDNSKTNCIFQIIVALLLIKLLVCCYNKTAEKINKKIWQYITKNEIENIPEVILHEEVTNCPYCNNKNAVAYNGISGFEVCYKCSGYYKLKNKK